MALGEHIEKAISGEQAPSTPAETPASPAPAAATAPEGKSETAPSPAPEAAPSPTQQADDLGFDWNSLAPEVMPLAKQLQADYTKKTQTLAEQRKRFEGLDDGTISAVRQITQLAEQDPAQAAAWLRQQADLLNSRVPQPEPNPYADFVPVTDQEQFLLTRLQQLEQQQQQFQQFHQQQIVAQQKTQINSEFDTLEKEAGRAISQDEREKVAQWCVEHRVPDVKVAWFYMNRETLLQTAAQKARDEASTVVQQKAGAAPPPSVMADRSAGQPATAPKGLRAMAEYFAQQAGVPDW